MSKIREALGVEIGEEFDIQDGKVTTRAIFQDSEEFCIVVRNGMTDRNIMYLLMDLISGKAKVVKPLLTRNEQTYLEAACDPKFHDGKIHSFRKIKELRGYYAISITTILSSGYFANINLFYFKSDKPLFKNMILDEDYTPKQLKVRVE